MYMIVFATLMISLISVFAQLYAKQATRTYAQQTGVVDALITWHGGAMDIAQFLLPRTFPTCSMTNNAPLGGLAQCSGSGGGSAVISATNSSGHSLCVVGATGVSNAPCYTTLPLGYADEIYKFYSVAYSSGGINYVLSFVPQPPTAGDTYGARFLCLPGTIATGGGATCAGSARIGLTFDDLSSQIRRHPALALGGWGIVSASNTVCSGYSVPCLVMPSEVYASDSTQTVTKQLIYPLPSLGGGSVIPQGSIGIIGMFSPCPSCT